MTMSKWTDVEFARIYNQSNSTEEVVEKTGTSKASVHSRSARYRKLGVRLKRFTGSHGRMPVNVEGINRILEEEGLAAPVEANGEVVLPSLAEGQPVNVVRPKRSHKKKAK